MAIGEFEISASPSLQLGHFISITPRIDDDAEAVIGRVALAWSVLDTTLRLALKRLEELGWKSPRGQEIDQVLTHGQLIPALRRAISTSRVSLEVQNKLRAIIDEIGEGRRQGLYGERNAVIHAVAFRTERRQLILGSWSTATQQAHAIAKARLLPSKFNKLTEKLIRATDPLVGR